MIWSKKAKARPGKARRRFLFGRFAKNSDGATAIEFGLLAIPFLMAMFAILETGISMAAQQLLTVATDDLARQIRTGQLASVSQSQLKTNICNRIKWLVATNCPGLQVDLRTYASFQSAAAQQVFVANDKVILEYDAGGNAKALKAEMGVGGTKQSLRVFYFWPVMTYMMQSQMGNAGNGKALLSASQTWQNEKF